MPKQVKKTSAAAAASVPITHFFSRKTRTDGPPSSPPTSQPQPLTQSENLKPKYLFASRNKEMSGSLASPAGTSCTLSDASMVPPSAERKIMDAVEITSPSRALDFKYSTRQRKPVFDSDSDGELPAPAVYVLRSPPSTPHTSFDRVPFPPPLRATENLTNASQMRNRPKKMQRLSSPMPERESIPTSQPDERDITLNHLGVQVLRPIESSMDKWLSSAPHSPVSKDIPSIGLHDALRSMSPPPMDDPLSTPSPHISSCVLSPDSKTAQIIANIKEKAYADSLQIRAETPVREFRDELSDGSDDDLLPASPMPIKSFRKQLSPTASKGTSKGYELRNLNRMLPLSRDERPTASSSDDTLIASPIRPFHVKRKRRGKIEGANPIDELLKEKKQLDALGKGCKALRQAEAALADRDAIMLDTADDDFTNEDAAKKSIMEYKQKALKSSSPTAYCESDDELKDEERERLLGAKHAKEVSKLLQSDTVNKEREKMIEKVAGVSLWPAEEEMDNLMEVDDLILPIPRTSSPQLVLLQNALEHQDIIQAILLIDVGIDHLSNADYPFIIPYFCQLALSLNETALCQSALQYLSRIWEASADTVPGITFLCISSTLAQLGAQPSVFDTRDWVVGTKRVLVPSEMRHAVLYRLIMLVKASARFKRLLKGEIPDILMTLILIANEHSTPHDLQCDIVLTINEICYSLAPELGISNYEYIVCTKVLNYLSMLAPVNKAYITNLFGSGTGPTKRIARWIAYGIITDQRALTLEQYSELPPLLPLVEELTHRHSGHVSDRYGKFEQHTNTDFADMMCYVEILAISLTNVEGYVIAERTAFKSSNTESTASPKSPLKIIRLAIEKLHSAISDIRATHLDRSRTKAALKELSLRLHYQRQAALQSSGTLHTYFGQKSGGSLL